MATVAEVLLAGGTGLMLRTIGRDLPDGTDPDVFVLVRAADGRLAVGPLGAHPSVDALWYDCGMIGEWQDDPLAAAVHAAWDKHWRTT